MITAMRPAAAIKNKLTKVEEQISSRNVITHNDINNYEENYGIVPETLPDAPGSYEITHDGNPFGGYTVEQIPNEHIEKMPKWMGEMALSMIPIVGDGIGVVRQLINKFTTGEMDELDFTLSLIGLGMDLPFDAGFAGDTAVAVLKGFSAMIPAGPAREVLLDAVKLLFDNPEGISAMAGAVWKMMGSEDLVKLLVDNPKLMNSVLKNSGHADELLEYGDDAARLVDELGEEGVKELLDSGLTIATKNNYRKLYLEQFPDLPKKWQVHHTLPQKYESIMKSAGINIHDIEFLKGVDPDIHPFITNEWMKWDRSLDHTPSADEIADFAKNIDAKYAKYWFN